MFRLFNLLLKFKHLIFPAIIQFFSVVSLIGLKLFTRLWPILIPIFLYFLWYKFYYRKNPHKYVNSKEKLSYISIMITFLLIIILLLSYGVFTIKPNDGEYKPAHINKDGNLIPSKIH